MRNLQSHFVLIMAVSSVTGCASEVRTHPVAGKIEVSGAAVTALAGSHFEIARVGDRNVRASGEIQADGSFQLQTNHAGVILDGAFEGQYQARIILTDESRDARRRAAAAIAPRYLDFATSGLTVQVPGAGAVVLVVAAR